MSDIVISVTGLGKRYSLGAAGSSKVGYTALRDVIANKTKSIFRNQKNKQTLDSNSKIYSSDFWALKDVSFDIKQGEVVGIIGRNGAGKSTLLKVLSRITDPSEGRIKVKGRIASLLEVGTGFHPELSGRENIYLNGAILGMKRAEIKAKFDEIVAFAEVEKFLDTPVKRYSSGMYVRLAFAVAAHLEPEILIVDEVLAVGDAEFQKKCLGKMGEVSRGGRTVLFVSHNMGALRGFCSSGILLESGSVKLISETNTVITAYLSRPESDAGSQQPKGRRREGTGQVEIIKTTTANLKDELQNIFSIGEPMCISIQYLADKQCEGSFFLLISNQEGVIILSSFQRDSGETVYFLGANYQKVLLKDVDLSPGQYTISAGILDLRGGFIEWLEEVANFEVIANFYDGRVYDQRLGQISKRLHWGG
jgi:lipopolysaccharide transport system ATP-binding protein